MYCLIRSLTHNSPDDRQHLTKHHVGLDTSTVFPCSLRDWYLERMSHKVELANSWFLTELFHCTYFQFSTSTLTHDNFQYKALQGCSADWSANFCIVLWLASSSWPLVFSLAPLLCYLILAEGVAGGVHVEARTLIEIFLQGAGLSLFLLENGRGASNYRKGTLMLTPRAFYICTVCNSC